MCVVVVWCVDVVWCGDVVVVWCGVVMWWCGVVVVVWCFCGGFSGVLGWGSLRERREGFFRVRGVLWGRKEGEGRVFLGGCFYFLVEVFLGGGEEGGLGRKEGAG